MTLGPFVAVVIMVLFAAAIVSVRRRRRAGGRRVRRGPGAGAAGAIYDMLNADKRNAIEVIVEERAEERDPETADGNLPELEDPGGGPPGGRRML